MAPLANESLRHQFDRLFRAGGRTRVIRSPGRVNLIGEHTDYNDGFVFPMAIEPEIRIVCRGRDDGRIRVASGHFDDAIVEFVVDGALQPGEPTWANYVKGVAAEMVRAGIPLSGMDAYIVGTLPLGGGLSSSAALEVGVARALLTVEGLDMDLSRLARLCQKAEHEFAHMPCGIMDQTIVAMGRAGHAMLLDCRDLSKQFVPLNSSEVRIVIVDSAVKHVLPDSPYAKRRRQCEEGVRFFQATTPAVRALRDVSAKQLDEARPRLDDVVFRRCRHVVTENQRTTEAAQLLARGRYEQVGQLMLASHQSLKDDYEVTVAETDFLVAESMKVKGVYGARMTGGGFGGCIVALAQPRAVEPLGKHLKTAYHAQFGKTPTIIPTTAAAGAGEMDEPTSTTR